MQSTFQLAGLTCAACVKVCEMKVKKIPGVTVALCDGDTQRLKVEAERAIEEAEIKHALEGTDYRVVGRI